MGEGSGWGGGTFVCLALVVSSPTKGDVPSAASPFDSVASAADLLEMHDLLPEEAFDILHQHL